MKQTPATQFTAAKNPQLSTLMDHVGNVMPSTNEAIQIGVVGLGKMGSAISDRLILSGRSVLGWDSSPTARSAFVAKGGTVATGLAEMGRASVVISVVWDDEATRAVAFGPHGLVSVLPKSATHLAMGTISPALSRVLDDAHRAKGQGYLAATMFGRPEAAAAGTVLIVCSGANDTYESIKSVFDPMGTTRWIGDDPQQANLVKLMGNNMIFVAIGLLGEMFALLRKAGVSDQNVRELLVERLFPGQFFPDMRSESLTVDGARQRALSRLSRAKTTNSASRRRNRWALTCRWCT
jgi:3-hydroxyisobutyrate dehydrogenase-like beta-hydroxyacid dehydrogenase